MTLVELIKDAFKIPIELHETTNVRVQLFDSETDESWTHEQHEALNARFQLGFYDEEGNTIELESD